MLAAHEAFLAAWESGVVPSRGALRAAALEEVDDAGLAGWVADSVAEDADSRPVADFLPEYRNAVAHDRELLARLRDRLAALDASSDQKLALLRRLLESSPAQKVAVFASFGDTVAYLAEHLPETVGGRSRAVVIGSQSDPDSRAATLGRFCPTPSCAPDMSPRTARWTCCCPLTCCRKDRTCSRRRR
jgi:hypothetical protein